MKKIIHHFLALFIGMTVFAVQGISQTKRFNLQSSLPSAHTVCGKSDSMVFELRNISPSAITNIVHTLKLPPGCFYKPSSVKGSGISESNVSDLNAPVFQLNNFTLAGYLKFSIVIHSTCDLQAFISKGGQAIPQLNFTYSGGGEVHYTSALNVSIPNLLINTISNQVKNAYLNDKFIREISIKNTGKGGAMGTYFFRTSGTGVKVISSRSKDIYSKDSIISKLDSNDFKKIGNKDIYFDANEEVKISDTVWVKNCKSLNTIYTLRFGCGNTQCNLSTKNAIINLDPFIQGLKITPKSTINWCFDKTKPTLNELMVVNNSNKPINNSVINVLQSYSGGFYNYQMSSIDTSTIIIRVGKYGKQIPKNIAETRNNYIGSYFSCLGTSPIGAFSLYLGDMNVKDSLYITWKSISCTPDVCNVTYTAHRWVYSATYFDACGSLYSVNENWGSVGGIQYMTALPWIPTDLIAGVPDKLNMTISGASFFPMSNKARFAVQLTLPSGIKHSLNANDLKFTDVLGNQWKPYTIKVIGSNIMAYFTSPVISLSKTELDIVVEADCKAFNPSGFKDYSIKILSIGDSTCTGGTEFQLYCATGRIKVHCSPSCSNGGMLFKSFTVKRKNFGKPDNNNDGIPDGSGSLDFSKIKTNRVMYGDTLSTVYSGIVRASGSVNQFYNAKLSTSIVNGNLLKPLVANLTIFRGGRVRYTCNRFPVSTSLSGTTRLCDIDMTLNAASSAGCGNLSNYFFLASDSVVVTLNYVYDKSSGTYSTEAIFNNSEFFVSTTPNPSQAQKLQCDTLSGKISLLGHYFTNWYSETYNSTNCSPVTLYNSFYFSAGSCCDNYAGGNIFPYEYRNFNNLEKFSVVKPKGYTFSSATIYYYRTSGTSKYATQIAGNLRPKNLNSDTLEFNLDTLFHPTTGIFQRSDDGFMGTFAINLTPGCKVSVNTSEPVHYLSHFKWTGTNAVDILNNYPDYLSFDHPEIGLAAINSVSISKKDTFIWDIAVTNSRSGSAVSNVWLGNTLKQKATIIAVKDLSTGNNLPMTNGIFKAGNLTSTTLRNFRIYATSQNCKSDSIKLAVGWNCDKYPDSVEVFECKNQLSYINLTLSPEPPLIVSTLLEDKSKTDVCTNRKYQALISNVDEDIIYGLKLNVTIPAGMKFTDTGLYYSYPYGTKNTRLPKPKLISGNTYQWALSDSLVSLKNGLDKVSDSLKSKILLEFLLETNCQITAGAFVSILPEGKMGCGEPVRAVGFTGSPIQIKGVDNPYFTNITLTPDSVNLCIPIASFKAKVIYLGPTPTRNNDSILLFLPKGFEPDTNSFKGIKITGKGKVTEVNEEMVWKWAIPKNLQPGDSSMLDFDVKITPKAPACGTKPFLLQAVTKMKAYCVKTMDSCDINSATGTYYRAVLVDRAEPYLRMIKATSVNAGDSGEVVNLIFSATNNKKTIDTSITTYFNLIVDKNSNGKADKSDKTIVKFSKTKGWLNKQQVQFTFNGFVKNSEVCKLLIVSDTSNCQCSPVILPILNIALKNAGRDTSMCSNAMASIGSDSIKTYTYEWIPSNYLNTPFKSRSVYKKPNLTKVDESRNYILKTTRQGCVSLDTVIVKSSPFITLPKLKDSLIICQSDKIDIGDTAKGGKGFLTYSWSPSSGLSVTNQMVVKAKPAFSTKYYLTVQDQNKCKVSDSTYIKVASNPYSTIGYTGNCEGSPVNFKDLSNYYADPKGIIEWKINDIVYKQTNPSHTFDAPSLYLVNLKIGNSYGCLDSTKIFLTIVAKPIQHHSIDKQCMGDSVVFTDTSSKKGIRIRKVSWEFAKDTMVGNSISKVFKTPGMVYFNHVVENDSGCLAKQSDSIEIFPKPMVGFSIKGKCASDTFVFANASTVKGKDSIAGYTWLVNRKDYGSKNNATLKDTSGNYEIFLKVNTLKGCSDSFKRIISIHPLPKANFTVNDGCIYDTIKVMNGSTLAKGVIKSHDWQLNNVAYPRGKNFNISSLNSGTYTIKLNVKTDSSCVDSIEKTFRVHLSLLPVTAFIQGCENETMRFYDISDQTNTRILSRKWQIGSSLYTDSSFSYALNNKGIFPFQLSVTTTEGCTFTKDSTFRVYEKPKPEFTFVSLCYDNKFSFTDVSLPGTNTTILSRQWKDSGVVINNGTGFNYAFPKAGNRWISLRVMNSLGCEDSIVKTLTVNPPMYADFEVNDACPEDIVNAKFIGKTYVNTITKYALTWGDGEQSDTLPAFHRYGATGKYRVFLNIETTPGCTMDTFKIVEIFAVPKPDFDFYPQYPDVKNPSVTITDKSKGAIKWYYSFGDSTFAKVSNPNHSFKDSGRFYIKQIVENQFGCVDSVVKDVYVNFILFTHIADAFSPNIDDINPVFQPVGLGIKDFKIIVFNRWGEKIFDPGWGRMGWDGTYQNQIVPMGVYPYYIEVLDFGNFRHNYHGVVNVIR